MENTKKDSLEKIFQKIKYESEPALILTIWHKLLMRDQRIYRIKFWSFTFLGLTSFASLIPAFRILSNDLVKSGFYEYFSLIFSDSGSILSYWKEFSLSIAESLPVISILSILSLTFIFFLSLRYLLKVLNNPVNRIFTMSQPIF